MTKEWELASGKPEYQSLATSGKTEAIDKPMQEFTPEVEQQIKRIFSPAQAELILIQSKLKQAKTVDEAVKIIDQLCDKFIINNI